MSVADVANAPSYPFLLIDVPVALAEVASEQLFELGAQGVEQRDATTLIRGAGTATAILPFSDVVIPTMPEVPVDDVVTLVAAFTSDEEALEALDAFDVDLNPRIEHVVGDGWRDAWKEHFAPFRLSPRIVIKPPWRDVDPDLLVTVQGFAPFVLELEPGRAFGTGLHETTMLVAQVVDDYCHASAINLPSQTMLDVGTGSGILALVGLTLGFGHARAVDLDDGAVQVAQENAVRLGLAERLHADTTDVRELAGTYPLVLANIQAEVLEALHDALVSRVSPAGKLVLSGILTHQETRIVAAFDTLKHVETRTRGDWVAIVFEKS